ncbi:MAG: hypothetical protein SZ59_C0002G0025 [candidate division TM6 bacterium GW2011_GWF2_28_16]|jgi:membrane-bound ClpP family serine protease|nr:MAG: hypothetical protein SZ59_C0002G0025 [candidate division TM6 bacterium GW2011_GWF2_28_16]
MNNNIKGLFLIILGSIIFFVVAAAFVLKALIALFGLYMIYIGLKLRSYHNFAVYFYKVKDKFNNFDF